MKTEYKQQIIPAALIFLFTYAALSKLADVSFFQLQLTRYPYFANLAPRLAIGIPVAELLIAGCLLLPRLRRWGLPLSLLVLLLFTLYLVMMLYSHHKDLPCSCGGVIGSLSWPQHVVFNLFFASLAFLGWKIEKGYRRTVLEARKSASIN